MPIELIPRDHFSGHGKVAPDPDDDVRDLAQLIIELQNGLNGGGPNGGGYYAETLLYTDLVNKIMGPLSETPVTPVRANLFVITGPPQDHITDFTVREVVGGSAPGWYICVSTASTAPGGGSFLGGINPATGLESVLENGDKARVAYANV